MTVAGPPAGVGFRRLRWERLPEVLALERELFPEDAWSEALFWSELAEVGSRWYRVAVDDRDGRLLGYAGLCAYDDEAYVQTLAVAPDAQGRGVGAALLAALVAEAAAREVDDLLLEVRADNTRAQALYDRFGFRRVGLRRGYYQPSGVDAVVMALPGVRRLGRPGSAGSDPGTAR